MENLEVKIMTVTEVTREGLSRTINNLETDGVVVITKGGYPVAMLQSLTVQGYGSAKKRYERLVENDDSTLAKQIKGLLAILPT